ncbi:MAG: hypothetical protein Q7K33_01110 [Candidatus Berkelbacteria bacterium]|nr:hypothetical protein [Candidatus Berkelbacteria bacterium]
MSSDTGLFVRQMGPGRIVTGEVNLSTGHVEEVRTVKDAGDALADIENRAHVGMSTFEDVIISGFADLGPRWHGDLDTVRFDGRIERHLAGLPVEPEPPESSTGWRDRFSQMVQKIGERQR